LGGLWGGAHLRHAIPFQRKLTFLFHSSRSALFLSFAVTPREDKRALNPLFSLFIKQINPNQRRPGG